MHAHMNMPGACFNQVFLDNKLVPNCIEAYEEEGWARYYDSEELTPRNGFRIFRKRTKIVDGVQIPIEVTKYGHVEIRPMFNRK